MTLSDIAKDKKTVEKGL